MLSRVPALHEILPAVRCHHERWDGTGYPDGLAGEQIPRDALILLVADAFDAMTSSRTYREALPVEEAVRRMRQGSGSQFKPAMVEAFERALADGSLRLMSTSGISSESRAQSPANPNLAYGNLRAEPMAGTASDVA
jgi:HD-GYP domain-containing protein (c-di-GMP phosphodiesterase class II)